MAALLAVLSVWTRVASKVGWLVSPLVDWMDLMTVAGRVARWADGWVAQLVQQKAVAKAA